MSFQAPLTIGQAVEAVHQRRYLLPAIQREFVWSTRQIEQLFDSIMRGYPIGSFLFWQVDAAHVRDYQYYDFIQHYHERTNRHNVKADVAGQQSLTAILDGQQRLTSLYIGMRGSYAHRIKGKWANNANAYPRRVLYLDLLEEDDDWDGGYRFRFLTTDEAEADPARWFQVGRILDIHTLAELNSYLRERNLDQVQHASTALFTLFESIRVRTLVNYFLETSQDLDTVLNIFIRVNSGGTTLSYSDLLLSVATAQWQKLDAREEITQLVERLNARPGGAEFRFDRDFVLKACLVLADIPSVAFKVTNFTNDNMAKIEEAWPQMSASLEAAVDLVASYGLTGQSLTSNNSVIPIAYYLLDRGLGADFARKAPYADDRAAIRRWLVASLVKGSFGGQSDTVLNALRTAIKESHGGFPVEAIAARLAGMYRSIRFSAEEIDALLDGRYGQRQTAQILALLYPGINYQQQYHLDHLHPRSRFTFKGLLGAGFGEDDARWMADHVDDLANLTVLEGWENIEKSDSPLAVWLGGKADDEQRRALDRHHVPAGVPLEPTAFREFHAARRAALASLLADALMLPSGAAVEAEPVAASPGADADSVPASVAGPASSPSPEPEPDADVEDPSLRAVLRNQARPVLEDYARSQRLLTYGQLAVRLGLDLDDPAARTVMSSILGDISEAEVLAGRPMLSAIVVQAETQVPGTGFYALGQLLGLVQEGEDPDMFAFRQMKDVWTTWR